MKIIIGTLEALPPLRTEDLLYNEPTERLIDLPILDGSEDPTEDMIPNHDESCAGCGKQGHDYFACPDWFAKYRTPLV